MFQNTECISVLGRLLALLSHKFLDLIISYKRTQPNSVFIKEYIFILLGDKYDLQSASKGDQEAILSTPMQLQAEGQV